MKPRTRAFFAAGGAASGIVVTLTGSFILLYYSHALGAPAGLVGLALAGALVFDAFWDPIVGYLSDSFRSRWGRRHPFMSAAVLPVTLLCWAVWNPPASLGPQALPLYLFMTIVPLRLSLALFDVPSSALTAELTSDYDERTRLATYRACCSWLFITSFMAALYGYWLRNTPAFPDGLLNAAGYRQMGQVAALMAAATMLVCALGLHPMIPRLPTPSERVNRSPRDLVLSVLDTFRESTLAPLLIASAAISTGFAIYGALFAYQFGYFWGLSTAELSGTTLAWALGLGLGFAAPALMRRFREKRALAMAGMAGLCMSVGCPVALGFASLTPSSGGPARYLMLCGFLFFDMITYLMITASLASMLADAVEHRELKRGRREEGTIFAAQTLILKISSAIGVLIAGLLLDLIRFPAGGAGANARTIHNLGLVWVSGNIGFYLIAITSLVFYKLTRAGHARNVEALSRRKSHPPLSA